MYMLQANGTKNGAFTVHLASHKIRKTDKDYTVRLTVHLLPPNEMSRNESELLHYFCFFAFFATVSLKQFIYLLFRV